MNRPFPRLEEVPFTPDDPQPLLRELPPGEPYPVAALGPLRAAVEAVQARTLAPLAIPAGSALAVASLAVQGFADVQTLAGPCRTCRIVARMLGGDGDIAPCRTSRTCRTGVRFRSRDGRKGEGMNDHTSPPSFAAILAEAMMAL